jgi:anti-sigma factor RsiW
MRCQEVREILGESGIGEAPAGVREHLGGCPACAADARDWKTLQAGLRLMGADPVPGPSLGFTARVLRRLEETTRTLPSREELLERAGRRMVYATLLVALALVLALVLPSSGPVRTQASTELYPPEPAAVVVENNPILIEDAPLNRLPALSAPKEDTGR